MRLQPDIEIEDDLVEPDSFDFFCTSAICAGLPNSTEFSTFISPGGVTHASRTAGVNSEPRACSSHRLDAIARMAPPEIAQAARQSAQSTS
jgi:hypothetical protein